jgi:hypothetical protein
MVISHTDEGTSLGSGKTGEVKRRKLENDTSGGQTGGGGSKGGTLLTVVRDSFYDMLLRHTHTCCSL